MNKSAFILPFCVSLLAMGSGCLHDSEAAPGDAPVGSAPAAAQAVGPSSDDAVAPGQAAPPARPSLSAACPVVDSASGSGSARDVTVDAQQVVGSLRSLQGAHWDPGPAGQALSRNYIAAGVDMVRTHDAGGIFGGTGVGDIDGPGRARIFPNMSADPNNPASYNFGPTDKLLANIRAAGAEVFFRVGRSNLGGDGVSAVPADFRKYAEIVKHVVMHYNQGWANGFKYGIRYFEVWNEPDFKPFWVGTPAQYHELYKQIAIAIKGVEPTALVGGPANSTFNDKTGLRATFLKYVRDNALPLDFYSFHKYTNKSQNPTDFARMARSFRDELDAYGFTRTEIVNSEYESSLQGDVILGGAAGNAAFVAESLMYMQDAPVDKAHSYMRFGAGANKESLAFKAVSALKATPARLCAQGGDDKGFAVLAGRNAASTVLQVLIANYQISKSLMGPIPGGNEEVISFGGRGSLATMTYPERQTLTYPNKDGYALTVKSLPADWGDVTVKQYRIDASNDLTLVSTKVVKAAERSEFRLTVSGSWARARPTPPNDPTGAAQGLDLIVLSSAAAAPELALVPAQRAVLLAQTKPPSAR